jgi:hypothetical protein
MAGGGMIADPRLTVNPLTGPARQQLAFHAIA